LPHSLVVAGAAGWFCFVDVAAPAGVGSRAAPFVLAFVWAAGFASATGFDSVAGFAPAGAVDFAATGFAPAGVALAATGFAPAGAFAAAGPFAPAVGAAAGPFAPAVGAAAGAAVGVRPLTAAGRSALVTSAGR
jgi:hypothetical protein